MQSFVTCMIYPLLVQTTEKYKFERIRLLDI